MLWYLKWWPLIFFEERVNLFGALLDSRRCTFKMISGDCEKALAAVHIHFMVACVDELSFGESAKDVDADTFARRGNLGVAVEQVHNVSCPISQFPSVAITAVVNVDTDDAITSSDYEADAVIMRGSRHGSLKR